MISRENLLALRNAINDVLAEMIAHEQTARKRLSKKEKIMQEHVNNYAKGKWNQSKSAFTKN